MTLQDLWLLAKHYAKWIIAVPILCALLVGGGAFASGAVMGENHKATATLTVTDLTGIVTTESLLNLVGAIAQDQANNAETDTIKVAVAPDVPAQSFAFSVESDNEHIAVETANGLAEATAELSKEALVAQGEEFLKLAESDGSRTASETILVDPMASPVDRLAALQSCVFAIAMAKEDTAKAGGMVGLAKYAAVGLVGGLLLVICILALIDSSRRPIKHEEDIRRSTDLPVLAKSSSNGFAERLWANVHFVAGCSIDSLCIVPVSNYAFKGLSKDLLSGVVEYAKKNADGASVAVYPPLDHDMSGAIAAHAAPATIVAVKTWEDTAAGFSDTLEELKIAKAHVVGVVFV